MLNATPTGTTQSKAPSNKRSAHTTGAAPNCYKHGYTWTRSHDQQGRPYSNSKPASKAKPKNVPKHTKSHRVHKRSSKTVATVHALPSLGHPHTEAEDLQKLWGRTCMQATVSTSLRERCHLVSKTCKHCHTTCKPGVAQRRRPSRIGACTHAVFMLRRRLSLWSAATFQGPGRGLQAALPTPG